MVILSIETVGTEKFIRGFNRYNAQMKDLREPLNAIADDFYKVEARNFRGGGVPEKFQPLSPRYAARKAKIAPGRPIMVLHGNLRNALTGTGGEPGKAVPIRDIKKQSGEFGVRSPYANRHQEGTFGMPQRKIVQLTENTKRRWGRAIHLWAVDQAQEYIEGTPGHLFRGLG